MLLQRDARPGEQEANGGTQDGDALFLPCVAGDDDTQDTWVYPGLPILARVTMKDGDVMANNGMFVVDSLIDEAIVSMASTVIMSTCATRKHHS